ncbi:MAG: DUF4350 domain-containing protein [Sandaracinaceae bacterium]
MTRAAWVKRIAAIAAVVLGFGVAGLMCQRVGARGRYAEAYSTYGAGPEGTRGLFLLTQELGAEPQRWSEELGRLPPGAMLVALGSCQEWMRRPLGRLEREALKDWVEAGGVLVVAGVPDYLTQEDFGVHLTTSGVSCEPTEGLVGMLARAARRAERHKERSGGTGEPNDDDVVEPVPDGDPPVVDAEVPADGGVATDPSVVDPSFDPDGPATPFAEDDPTELDDLPNAFGEDPAGVYQELTDEAGPPPPEWAYGTAAPLAWMPPIGMRQALGIRVEEDHTRRTLMVRDDGEEAAVRVDVGRGAVIALSSASQFTNRDLYEYSGGILFARLVEEYAPGGVVLFDEYHLGVGERRSLTRYLRQAGLAPFAMQLLFVVVLLVAWLGSRFGAPRRELAADPAGTASYVDGVGTLYAKAADPSGTLAIIAARALGRIAAHHRLPTSNADKMAEELDKRGLADAAGAVRAIAAELEGPVSARGLGRAVAAIDRNRTLAMQ